MDFRLDSSRRFVSSVEVPPHRRHEDATPRQGARSMPAAGTDVCWEDKVWLQHFPLSRHTVLDYFSNSPVSPA